MDLPGIITTVVGGLVLLVVSGGVAFARHQVIKVCAGQDAIKAEAAAAKKVAEDTKMQASERFDAIAERLDALGSDLREVRAVLLRSDGR